MHPLHAPNPTVLALGVVVFTKIYPKKLANLGPTSLSKEENEGEYLKSISTIKVNVCQQYKQTKT